MLCGPKTLMPKFISEFGVIIENDIKYLSGVTINFDGANSNSIY